MDFWVTVATVSPVLLVALSTTFNWVRVRKTSHQRALAVAGMLAAMPSLFVIIVSLVALNHEATGAGTWERDLVEYLVDAQVGMTIVAMVLSWWGERVHEPQRPRRR